MLLLGGILKPLQGFRISFRWELEVAGSLLTIRAGN